MTTPALETAINRFFAAQQAVEAAYRRLQRNLLHALPVASAWWERTAQALRAGGDSYGLWTQAGASLLHGLHDWHGLRSRLPLWTCTTPEFFMRIAPREGTIRIQAPLNGPVYLGTMKRHARFADAIFSLLPGDAAQIVAAAAAKALEDGAKFNDEDVARLPPEARAALVAVWLRGQAR